MSIFGSRNKTTVGTTVARVIDDNMLPDAIKNGAIQAIMRNSSQSVEYAMDELVSGLATRVDRMHRFGRTQYIHGSPEARALTAITGKAVVEQAIETDVGLVDSIDYYHLGPMNLLHIGWLKLVGDYAYDSSINTLVVDGRTVYLSNMQAVVTETNFGELENGSMDRWGPLPTAGTSPDRKFNLGGLERPPAFLVDAAAAEDYVKVSYCWEEPGTKVSEGVTIPTTELKTGVLNIPITGYSVSANYFQVRYLKGGKAGYWMYELNSGLKPEVDEVFDAAPTNAGTFLPWAYFRYNKRPITEDMESEDFKSNKRLLNKIGMDLEEIANGIHDNPDIADVEQAMMMMAVPAKTESEIEQRYLFDFFTKHYIAAQVNASDPAPTSRTAALINKELGGVYDKLAPATITIRDKRFKMALSFDRLIRRRVAGKCDGGVGPVPKEYHSGTNISVETGKVMTVAGLPADWPTDVATHYYRKQISENLYEEILVTRLKMVYWIWGEYTETADENEPALLIPLDYDIVQDYSLIDREKIYSRSLHYVFNSRVVTKLKWYQTGIFKALMIVVAVIITIYNIQLGMKALSAAIAAGATVQAIVYMVLTAAVKYMLITVGTQMFVKEFGMEAAFIVAIIAAAVGMYQVYDAGSVAGAPWATTLVNISSGLTKEIGVDLAKEMGNLLEDAKSFETYKKEKLKLLEDTQNLLNNGNHLTPAIIWGESPHDFYQRTVHSGNIGMVGIDAISSFVDMKLALPKLSETLGDLV